MLDMGQLQRLVSVVVAAALALFGSPEAYAASPSCCEQTRTFDFKTRDALNGWTITGDVTIDTAKAGEARRLAQDRSRRQGPAEASRQRTHPARSSSGSTTTAPSPSNVKAHRVGPRWGLVQNDGKLLAVGILYASYLGGDEGYTATACDGKDWFEQLFWLGVKRGRPAGTSGRLISMPRRASRSCTTTRSQPPLDSGKRGLKGFNADRHLGRRRPRAAADRSGWPTCRSRWAAR